MKAVLEFGSKYSLHAYCLGFCLMSGFNEHKEVSVGGNLTGSSSLDFYQMHTKCCPNHGRDAKVEKVIGHLNNFKPGGWSSKSGKNLVQINLFSPNCM